MQQSLPLGACTYDVRTGRGRGGTPKADMRTDKLRECDSDKEEDSRNKTILWTSHVHAPPSSFVFCTFRSILLLLSLLRRPLEVFSSLFAVARAPDSSEGKKERREARSEGREGRVSGISGINSLGWKEYHFVGAGGRRLTYLGGDNDDGAAAAAATS